MLRRWHEDLDRARFRFAAPGHVGVLPPPAAPPDSAGLLPEAAASRVSLVRVAEDPPEPPAPLRPHPLPSLLSDYSEDDGDLRPAPVGGRFSLFLSEWQ